MKGILRITRQQVPRRRLTVQSRLKRRQFVISKNSQALGSALLITILSLSPILPSLNPLILFGALSSRASTITWDGDGADQFWSNPANWSENRLPDANDIVTFSSLNTKDVYIDVDVSVAGFDISSDYGSRIEARAGKRITVGKEGFTQKSGHFVASTAPMTILGSFQQHAGTFTAPFNDFSIAGNMQLLGGTFEHNNGTVILNGIEQVLFGSAVFYNFQKISEIPETLEFQSGKTITIENTLRLKGSELFATNGNDRLTVRSSQSGEPVLIEPRGAVDLAYLRLSDMINQSPKEVVCQPGCDASGPVSGITFPSNTDDNTSSLLQKTTATLKNLLPGSTPDGTLHTPPAPASAVSARTNSDFAGDETVTFTLDIPTHEPNQATLTPATAATNELLPEHLPTVSGTPSTIEESWLNKGLNLLNHSLLYTPFAEADETTSVIDGFNVTATVIGPTGLVVDQITPHITTLEDGQPVIQVAKPDDTAFHPGKYQLQLTLHPTSNTDASQDVTITQDFTWGVLAVNVAQSYYQTDEPVDIGFGVLTNTGHTVCDAALAVVITHPDATTTSLPVDAITRSDTCGPVTVTNTPDYSASFTPPSPGNYTVEVTATISDGTRTMRRDFLVIASPDSDPLAPSSALESPPYFVVRQAPTRIFPPAPYTVEVAVTAAQDYTGNIIEPLPRDFVITGVSHGGQVVNTTPPSLGVGGPTDEVLPDPTPAPADEESSNATAESTPSPSPEGTPNPEAEPSPAAPLANSPSPTPSPSPSPSPTPSISPSSSPPLPEVAPTPSVTPSPSPETSPAPAPESTTVNNPPITVTESDGPPRIVWPDVSLKAGETVTLTYSFDAPDISPEFYLLGPLQVNSWQEPRAWQIAADAVITLSGTVYTNEGVTNVGANKTVHVAINGTDHGTTDETDASGAWSITDASVNASDIITAYLEDETENAVAVTVTDGSTNITNLDLYQNYLITRHDNAGSLTNANLGTAAVASEDDISSIYSVTGGALTVVDGNELLVWTGDTFAPGGAINVDDIDINGTLTLAANAASVTGSWDATGGSFTSSGTVTFAPSSASTVLSDGDSFNHFTVQEDNSLVGYWTFDEGTGTTAGDSTANNNDGTLTGGPTWSADPTNDISFTNPYALDFDGTNDYVAIGDTGETAVKSISFWMYAHDVSSRGVLSVDGTDLVEINSSGDLVATSFPGATIYVDGVADPTVTVNTWHHVTITDTTGVNASDLDVGAVSSSSFDLSTTRLANAFSVATQETGPEGMAFNSDGTKMFVIGSSGDDVNEYTLSAAYDITTATFVDSFSVSAQETAPVDVSFNSDGTKMFVLGSSGDDVNEYTLGTGFDVSTASFVDSFSISAQELTPSALAFSTDGTKMFVLGKSGDDVNEYTLGTGFDVSTASFVDSFSVATQETTPDGLAFNSDGTKMLIVGQSSPQDVNEYTLGTGFDVSTASFVDGLSVTQQESTPTDLTFNSDGTKMFVLGNITGNNSDNIDSFTLGTGFDISTGKADNNLSLSAKDTVPRGMVFNNDGTTLFIVGTSSDSVHEYSLSTAYDVSSATFTQTFSVSAQETLPVDLAFNSDGTKMFVLGDSGDDVNEYTLSAGFDISTASFVDSFSISAQELTAGGLSFNTDGTKMFVSGDAGNDVNEYTLGTGFDVSTASFVDSFSVSTQTTNVKGHTFSPDGTKMFVAGNNNGRVYEYTLGTGFDVSTASFAQSFDTQDYEAFISGVKFNPAGTKMFAIGTQGQDITEFDVGSRSYFDGILDDVRLYTRVLSTTDISTLSGGADIASSLALSDTLDVNGNLTLTSGTLDASDDSGSTSNNITLAGNWSNSATFTPRAGTVTLDGTDQSLTGSTTWYNLSKTESTNNAASVTLTIASSSTQTVQNTLTLDGLDSDDQILIRSSASPTRHTWDLTGGNQATDNLNVQDSQTSTNDITCGSCTDNGNNDEDEATPHWIFRVTGNLVIRGTAYVDEGTTALGSRTVTVAVNGTDHSSTETNATSGAYSLDSINAAATDIITVYLEDETENAVTVTESNGSDMSGLNLYQSRLITRCDNSCSLTNADLATGTVSSEADITGVFTVSGGVLTIAPKLVDSYLDGWWPMNEGADNTCAGGEDVCDATANANDGTIQSGDGDEWVTDHGPVANSTRGLDFNGTDEYVSIPDDTTLDLTGGHLTLSTFVKTSDGSAGLISHHDLGSPYAGWAFTVGVGCSSGQLSYWNSATAAWRCSSGTVNNGAWHHVALVQDGGTVTFYIDGAASGSTTGNSNPGNSSQDIFLGGRHAGNEYLDGTLDDVRIYNRALTSTEIAQLAGSNEIELYVPSTHTFAPGGAIIVDDIDINGTLTLGANDATVTGTWDATGGSFSSSATVSFAPTSSSTVLSDGDSFNHFTVQEDNTLVGYWKFDEGTGTNADDSSPGNNDGTLTGGPTWSADPTNDIKFTNPYGLDFDGTNDYVAIGDTGETAVKSISFWMYANDVSDRGVISLDGTDLLKIDGTGELTATSFPGATIYVDGVADATVTVNTWHHIVITDSTGVAASSLEVGRAPTGTAFSFSSASFNQNFSVASEETGPTGMVFNSTGTKMFVIGQAGDDVNEYTLSTAYNVSTASFVDSFSISSQETSPKAVAFNSTGTKMFVTGISSDSVHEYDLSTGFDVSSASFSQSFSVSTQESGPQGLAFNSDGTKMFVVGNSLLVNEYALGTGFDVSTASFTQSFNISSQIDGATGLAFNSDGTKMFVTNFFSADAVYHYDLYIGFDVSTAFYNTNFSVSSQEATPEDVTFNPAGTKMYITGSSGDDINEYDLGQSYYDGLLDDLRLYDRVIDSHEITNLSAGDTYATTLALSDLLDVNGNLSIYSSTLDASDDSGSTSNNITLAGNWSNSGTFTPRSGTVTLNGTSQALTGTTSFYNLSKTEGSDDTSDETLTFGAGNTFTVSNTLTLTGLDANDRINLVSSSPGTQYILNVTSGDQTVSTLDVTDSAASTNDITCNWCVNGGNNDDAEFTPHWIFNIPLTQNSWRWYVDPDTLDVTDPWPSGSLDIAQSTLLSVVPAQNDPPVKADELRIRVNATLSDALGSGLFAPKLQYGRGTACYAIASWTDVGAGGSGSIWRYATSSVSDNSTILTTRLSDSNVAGNYIKSAATGGNTNSGSSTQKVEWDFHIEHNGAADAASYCFRMVQASDGASLTAYNSYPQLETKPGTGDLMRHGNVFIEGIEKGATFAN